MSKPENDRHIDYIELPTADLNATERFFTSAFGWEFKAWGEDYASFSQAGLRGGFQRTSKVPAGGALVVLYAVDLRATRQRVIEAGGTILKSLEFPGGKRFHFREPGGGEFAVWAEE